MPGVFQKQLAGQCGWSMVKRRAGQSVGGGGGGADNVRPWGSL